MPTAITRVSGLMNGSPIAKMHAPAKWTVPIAGAHRVKNGKWRKTELQNEDRRSTPE
jgi:hypothetical protein